MFSITTRVILFAHVNGDEWTNTARSYAAPSRVVKRRTQVSTEQMHWIKMNGRIRAIDNISPGFGERGPLNLNTRPGASVICFEFGDKDRNLICLNEPNSYLLCVLRHFTERTTVSPEIRTA